MAAVDKSRRETGCATVREGDGSRLEGERAELKQYEGTKSELGRWKT